MSGDNDNWGDDLSGALPPERRADYLKWRARILRCDKNDEVIAIAGYFDAHTRIGLHTADRMEGSAKKTEVAADKAERAVWGNEAAAERMERAAQANQEAADRFEKALRKLSVAQMEEEMIPRCSFFRNPWFYAFIASLLLAGLFCGFVEIQANSKLVAVQQASDQIDQSVRQNIKDQNIEIENVLSNDTVLRFLAQDHIELHTGNCQFQDGGKGIYVYSPSAESAQMAPDKNGQQVGAVYFRLPPPPATPTSN